MAGIMPNGGVPPSQSQNTIASPNLRAGCDNKWYAVPCNARFDPFAANAVISEIVNAVNSRGIAYDCSRLDNLAGALASLVSNVDLCVLPVSAQPIRTTDFIAGCFTGITSIVSVSDLLDLVQMSNFCSLPAIPIAPFTIGQEWPFANGSVAVCANNTSQRANFSDLLSQHIAIFAHVNTVAAIRNLNTGDIWTVGPGPIAGSTDTIYANDANNPANQNTFAPLGSRWRVIAQFLVPPGNDLRSLHTLAIRVS